MTEKKEGSFRTTVEIGSDLYFLAKENKIQFKQAMIVGLSMLLVEKGIDPYENQLTLSRLYEETKIKASKPEAIVACSYRHENILMRQINELGMLGIKTYHLVAPFIASSDTKENRGLFEKNGAVSTWYGVAEAGIGDKQKEFIEKYQNRYGVKPTSEAIYVYDDVYILAESLRKCDKVSKVRDSNCIADNLLKTDFDGIGGKLSFDKNGVSTRKVTMIKIGVA